VELALSGSFFTKKAIIIWSIQKKVVPLRTFSAFGLQSSAAEGTDDAQFWACQRRGLCISPDRCNLLKTFF
jgi:hypothetical protein